MLLYITPKLSRDVIWESLKEENENIENAERIEVSLEKLKSSLIFMHVSFFDEKIKDFWGVKLGTQV